MFLNNCLFFIVRPRDTKAHCVNPLNFCVLHHKDVCLIFMFVNIFLFYIVRPRGTKDHWVNTLKIFKHNYVKFLKKKLEYKDSCCDEI